MNYVVKFSKRKSIALKINSNGNLEVYAPYNTPKDRVEYFINLKKSWIEGHQNRIKSVLNTNSAVLSKEKMYLFGELVDYSLEDFKNLIKIAKKHLNNRCLELSNALKLPINSVKIKNFRSRWGSCDAKKNISLNYRLIMLPKSTIDYVILHELCHTVYMDHQKNFHELLKRVSIKEKEHKKVLKYFNFVLKIDY